MLGAWVYGKADEQVGPNSAEELRQLAIQERFRLFSSESIRLRARLTTTVEILLGMS